MNNSKRLGHWYPYSNVTDYMNLYDTVTTAIRNNAALANETLVAPATGRFAVDFLEPCFQRGMLDTVDAISVHPYRPTMPETVSEDYAALRALMDKYNTNKRDIPIISGEWGYSTCSLPDGTIIKCDAGAQTGSNSLEDQAKALARQWLINAMNDIPVSIFYDWKNGGTNTTLGEYNFGTVLNVYNNESLPYTPKPSYHAASTLQTILGSKAFVQRLPAAVGDNSSDTLAYVLEFEDNHLAAWNTDGKSSCDISPRVYQDCGFSGISQSECVSRGCCYWPNQHTRPWCAFPGVNNYTGEVRFQLDDDGVTSLTRVDMLGSALPDVTKDADGSFHIVVDDKPQYMLPK
eukprot:TRINITY_DN12663_c1_g3_i3.p1 TRINITY_DN12663_c1_g3~~TRINITY_DN12663_c1_g3_i3.p1  ORF type:complete len:347 (+),score=62.91 TRINITY_DN12663_c1_g3_i3:405-1445(+)